jgi:hypothetical protein
MTSKRLNFAKFVSVLALSTVGLGSLLFALLISAAVCLSVYQNASNPAASILKIAGLNAFLLVLAVLYLWPAWRIWRYPRVKPRSPILIEIDSNSSTTS